MSIGVLAARTGSTVATIRYYEEVGLLPPAQRRASGHRSYPESAVDHLLRVRALRGLGIAIERIRELLGDPSQDAPANLGLLDTELRQRLVALRDDIAQLETFEAQLTAIVGNCVSTCASGPASCCSILDDLQRSLSLAPPAAPDALCNER